MKNILSIAIFVLLFASCKQVEYVTIPVREVHTEYVHDSVSQKDTVYHFNTIFTRGDTVFVRDSVVNTINTTYIKQHYTCDTVADTAQISLQARLIDTQQQMIEKQSEKIASAEKQSLTYRRLLFFAILICIAFGSILFARISKS